MANVTAAMVKDLREKTGAGMMDCKNALNEVSGDIEAAVDWLRKKGLSRAAKKSGRVAAEGLVAVAVSGRKGVLIEVNSETDFVARNADFQKLVRSIAGVALERGADVGTLAAAPYPGGGTVSEAIANAIATIGENMTLRRAAAVEVKQGLVGQYVHAPIAEGLGKIGVVVGLESPGDAAVLQTLGRQLAMHIAASSPLALDAASLDPATVAREKAVLAEKNAGKPPHVIEKIVESGLKSYHKEVSLLAQAYVHDNAKTVAQAVKDAEKTIGAPVAVTGFVRFALGEGVDKPETPDFASEVAKMV
ncbi:MAG TPA: translation elongation factor Ts [Lichenihabitans sp.]|jgi:elongation factor Ts|nr:translation elongation factor Ts [Lichenihabitans sp.]